MAGRVYTKAELADHAFYMEHRADILAAQREGRIAEDEAALHAAAQDAKVNAALERLRPFVVANIDDIDLSGARDGITGNETAGQPRVG